MYNHRRLDFLTLLQHAKTVAITGAGGKTTLMFSLARKFVEAGKKVITTTSTQIFAPDPNQSPLTVLTAIDDTLSNVAPALLDLGHVTIGRKIDPVSGKLKGVDAETILRFRDLADCTIIEADGAAGRSIKAPEAWEPVIPTFVDVVTFVIGLDALGQRVNENTVFRIGGFYEITGLKHNDMITPDALARLAYHPLGGLKGVPNEARFMVLLNKMDRLSLPHDLDKLRLAFERENFPGRRLTVVAANLMTGALVMVKE